MKTCKFCQMPEGAPGGRTGVIHINRDGLCGPCATLLDKIKYQPDKVPPDEMEQFVANCEWNFGHGLFVPIEQRRALRANAVWKCKACGRREDKNVKQDKSYINYCEACAEDIRKARELPISSTRKTRSDKGKRRVPKQ